MYMSTTPILNLEVAHKHSSHHRAEVEGSEICGCFYCLSTFPPAEIAEWIDEGENSALSEVSSGCRSWVGVGLSHYA